MTDRITSVHNPRIRNAVQLRTRDGRESQQRFPIDGVREISRALDAEIEICEVYVSETTLRPEGRQLVDRLAERGIRPCYVSEQVQSRLAFGERDEGIVAVARPPRQTLTNLDIIESSLVAVLVGLEKPGNIGAIIRSADAAGVDSLIVADGGTDLYNPNTVRASLGTIFAVPVVTASSSEVLAWLRGHRFQVLAARVEGARSYAEVSYAGRTAIVLGSESAGLGEAWFSDDIISIALPLLGVADSLNVSVTAAVLFYEALRQRHRGSNA